MSQIFEVNMSELNEFTEEYLEMNWDVKNSKA